MRCILVLLFFLSLFVPRQGFSQQSFVCFENTANRSVKLTVTFDARKKAKYVRYYGQRDSLVLVHSGYMREKVPGGGIPAYYWSESYLEKYRGKVTGEYTFTNAGTYQLDLTYTRKRDGKEFYFQVIESYVRESDDGPYRNAACF